MIMSWIDPMVGLGWVGLDWVGSKNFKVSVGWVGLRWGESQQHTN